MRLVGLEREVLSLADDACAAILQLRTANSTLRAEAKLPTRASRSAADDLQALQDALATSDAAREAAESALSIERARGREQGVEIEMLSAALSQAAHLAEVARSGMPSGGHAERVQYEAKLDALRDQVRRAAADTERAETESSSLRAQLAGRAPPHSAQPMRSSIPDTTGDESAQALSTLPPSRPENSAEGGDSDQDGDYRASTGGVSWGQASSEAPARQATSWGGQSESRRIAGGREYASDRATNS
ncbi:hypothetical protein T492DRAFT_1074533, partial [Pavlovales sp. CCMP2436]